MPIRALLETAKILNNLKAGMSLTVRPFLRWKKDKKQQCTLFQRTHPCCWCCLNEFTSPSHLTVSAIFLLQRHCPTSPPLSLSLWLTLSHSLYLPLLNTQTHTHSRCIHLHTDARRLSRSLSLPSPPLRSPPLLVRWKRRVERRMSRAPTVSILKRTTF
jgi:hypothetical protein